MPIHSDAAKRMADAVNLHIAALGFGAFKQWVAVALADGRSNGTLYETRRDAVRHQMDPERCAFVKVPPSRMNTCGAEAYLEFCRRAQAAGFRLTDPDHAAGSREVIPRLTQADQRRQLHALPPAFRR